MNAARYHPIAQMAVQMSHVEPHMYIHQHVSIPGHAYATPAFTHEATHHISTLTSIESMNNNKIEKLQRRQNLSAIRTHEPIPHPPFQTPRVENMSTRRNHILSSLQNHTRAAHARCAVFVGPRWYDGNFDVLRANAAIKDFLALAFRLARALRRSIVSGRRCV
jgi:hypothetical protein